MFCSFRKFYALAIPVLLTGISWSAALSHLLPASAPTLWRLTRQSGYIFAGTVIAVGDGNFFKECPHHENHVPRRPGDSWRQQGTNSGHP
jgi:hypothetical protein